MTFTTYADLQSAIAGGNKTWEERYSKLTGAPDASGVMHDTWLGTGAYPATGASPGSAAGVALSNTTTGSFPILRNPTNPDKRYLLTFGVAGSIASPVVLLADRLVHTSALSGTVTTPQTVNSTALTRYTTGDGVMLALVCWTATGTTASNVTVSYTNQAGTAGRTSPSIALWTGGFGGGTLGPSAGQMQPIPLAAGDTGVRSVQSVTLSASTLTAGDFGILLYKPLAIVQARRDTYLETDYVLQTSSLPELQNSACLSFLIMASSNVSSVICGTIKTVEG